MTVNSDLPLELGALQQLADTQPDVARELYHFALATVMVEKGKARIVEQHTTDGREHYTFASPECDALSLVKPNVSDALCDQMLTAVRAIVEVEFRQMARLDQQGKS